MIISLTGSQGTGWVSDKFVKDLLIPRDDAAARHVFQALGTSNEEKGRNFVQECYAEAPSTHPRAAIYTSYSEVYADELVDIVYVGIPHSLHKEACLAAIEAGKHVLCEKPITVNAKEAKEVIAAARKKGVFLMEGKPLIHCVICDVSLAAADYSPQLSGHGFSPL